MLNLAGFLVAFLIAGTLVTIPKVREVGTRFPLVAALTTTVLFLAVTELMPFGGYATELPILALTALCLVAPMSFVLSQNKQTFKPGDLKRVVAFGVVASGMGLVFLSSGARFQHADQLAWECDGSVARVFESPNHRVPSLEVVTGGHSQRFETVDRDVYGKAKPGMHLVKRWGTAFAELDGQRVRMVSPGNFRHDDGVP